MLLFVPAGGVYRRGAMIGRTPGSWGKNRRARNENDRTLAIHQMVRRCAGLVGFACPSVMIGWTQRNAEPAHGFSEVLYAVSLLPPTTAAPLRV